MEAEMFNTHREREILGIIKAHKRDYTARSSHSGPRSDQIDLHHTIYHKQKERWIEAWSRASQQLLQYIRAGSNSFNYGWDTAARNLRSVRDLPSNLQTKVDSHVLPL